jgi:tRNA 2-thiouridine synthesizing protein A
MAKGEGRRAERDSKQPEILVDARGLYCPLPILRLAKAFGAAARGSVARLLATDPASVEDVEVFCRERSHVLLKQEFEKGTFVFDVKKGP